MSELLGGSGVPSDGNQMAALILLEVSDDPDLDQMFAGRGLYEALASGVPPGSAYRERLEDFFNARFHGGADALARGEVAPHGLPRQAFDSWMVAGK